MHALFGRLHDCYYSMMRLICVINHVLIIDFAVKLSHFQDIFDIHIIINLLMTYSHYTALLHVIYFSAANQPFHMTIIGPTMFAIIISFAIYSGTLCLLH